MTEISHLYSLRDFWRHFGFCRAAAHSDCCFFAPCTNILTYLLTYYYNNYYYYKNNSAKQQHTKNWHITWILAPSSTGYDPSRASSLSSRHTNLSSLPYTSTVMLLHAAPVTISSFSFKHHININNTRLRLSDIFYLHLWKKCILPSHGYIVSTKCFLLTKVRKINCNMSAWHWKKIFYSELWCRQKLFTVLWLKKHSV